MGYTLFDFILITFCIKKRTRIIKQTIFHHIVLIVGFTSALIAGFYGPGTAACALFCETSSIFYCINELIAGKKYNRLELANQLCFFICYTLFRIVLFPYVFYLCIKYTIIFLPHLSVIRVLCIIIAVVNFFLVTVLNFYWYTIILKKLYKLIVGGK